MCQPLTIAGTGWIHPHDPTHAANSPCAFISLSVTVTHALHLPVYRLYSQRPCGGNDRLGGTGLLTQVLEEKPPEAWEWEGRGREGMPARWDPSEVIAATVYLREWLHPGAWGNARVGTTSLLGTIGSRMPAGQGWVPPTRLQLQKVKRHQPGNCAHSASLISHQWMSSMPTLLGPGMGEGPQNGSKGMKG